jgi:FAD synthase
MAERVNKEPAFVAERAVSVHMGYMESTSDEGGQEVAGGPNVTFLYSVVEGPSKGSYGLNVARSSGMSTDFLHRAEAASKWMRERKPSGPGAAATPLATSVAPPTAPAPAPTAQGTAFSRKRTREAEINAAAAAEDKEEKKYQASIPNILEKPDAVAPVATDATPTKAVPPTESPVEKERRALQKLIEESQQRLQQLTQSQMDSEAQVETETETEAEAEAAVDAARIRSLVEEGSVEEAAAVLGRLPCLKGSIVHGEKRGRTIGYPTANLGEWDANAVDAVPADGIYAGWLHVDTFNSFTSSDSDAPMAKTLPCKGNHGFRQDGKGEDVTRGGVGGDANKGQSSAPTPAAATNSYAVRLPAAISIGTNPTFDGQRSRQVEAFALNQKDWIDLYDKRAKIEFVSFLRPTIKFSGASWLDDLLAQMKQDCAKAADILAKREEK